MFGIPDEVPGWALLLLVVLEVELAVLEGSWTLTSTISSHHL